MLQTIRSKLPEHGLKLDPRMTLIGLALIAALLAVGVVFYLWRDQGSFRPLYGSGEAYPAAEVMQVLDGDAIVYRLHPQSGQVLVREDQLGRARMLLAAKGVQFLLPTDVVLADNFAPDANSQIAKIDAIPDGWMGLDIGPDSVKVFQDALADCQTVIWNGPMGVFEFDKFAAGTNGIAHTLAELSAKGTITIIGPGTGLGVAHIWRNAWGFDALYHLILVKPYLMIARLLGRDPVDRIWGVLPIIVRAGNSVTTKRQTGSLRGYAAAIAIGSVILLMILIVIQVLGK